MSVFVGAAHQWSRWLRKRRTARTARTARVVVTVVTLYLLHTLLGPKQTSASSRASWRHERPDADGVHFAAASMAAPPPPALYRNHNLTHNALRLGMPLAWGMAPLLGTKYSAGERLCVPNGLAASGQSLARWLDKIAGICAIGMHFDEIIGRTVQVLDARSTAPESYVVEDADLEQLYALAVNGQALLPNRLPTAEFLTTKLEIRDMWHWSRRYPNQIWQAEPGVRCFAPPCGNEQGKYVPDTYWAGWLAKAAHGVVTDKAIASLDAFEFNLLAQSSLFNHPAKVTFMAQAPTCVRTALLLVSFASPLAERVFHTAAWVENVQSMVDELQRVRSAEDAEVVANTAIQQVASLAELPAFAPAFVDQVATLLRVEPALAPASSDHLVQLSAADPLPRALWSSPSLAELPRWSGGIPAARTASGATVIALVIPFHSGELAKIRFFMSRWPTTPQSHARASGPASLTPVVFAMNADFASPAGVLAEQSIRAIISVSGVTSPVFFLSLRQPGATNHYDGAAMSFYQLQKFLGAYFGAMQLVETDVVLAQPDWSGLMQAEAAGACGQWWIKGSAQLCSPFFGNDIDARLDYHINGNALYALGCPGFDEYIRRVQAYYPPAGAVGGQCVLMGGCETGKPHEGGYDHAVYRYRREPANYHYTRTILSKFLYTTGIVNYCEDDYAMPEVLAQFPSAYLVHSKFHMWSEEEQAVRRLFNTIRSTNPSAEDLIQLWPKLHHRLLSEHQVATTLCSGLAVPKRRFLPLACNTNLIMAAGATSARDAAVSRQRVVAAHLHGLSAQMVQCISTTLRAEGVAIRASTDPAICHAFGDCVGSNSTAPEIGLAICGEPHPSCEQADESSVKAVYVLSADSILDAASGNPGWLRGMASAVAKPQAVVIATDAFAVRFAELSFPGTGVTLAPAWCGDHGDNFAAIETGGHSSNFVAGYLPVSPTVLVWSALGDETAVAAEAFAAVVRKKMAATGSASGYRPKAMSELYKAVPDGLKICQHVAVVIPSTCWASPLTVATLYRMKVPLFLPTTAYYAREQGTALGRTLAELSPSAGAAGVELAHLLLDDAPNWPGVRHYDSEQDLARQLESLEIGNDLKVALAADGSTAEFNKVTLAWRSLL